MRNTDKTLVKLFDKKDYKYGFKINIASNVQLPGLNKKIIRNLSKQKKEPKWMLKWRLEAYLKWLKMKPPFWAIFKTPEINYKEMSFYSSPQKKYLDKKLLHVYKKLGVNLYDKKKQTIAIDAVLDSVSIATTYKKKLYKLGIIFCSISEAIMKYCDLIQLYLGSVVPNDDNYFASLNSAVFTDGSFVFLPEGKKSPIELSTYFRLNSEKLGQFERTLIICEKRAEVSYLEGCTATIYDSNQLHAAVVELIAFEESYIKYSTVQNWYPGNKFGKGGIYNFVTKRGLCKGIKSKISWIQLETGSAITWKYPSCILLGEFSKGEFYSMAITNKKQKADTGTKMIHIGSNTKSTIIAKGVAIGKSKQAYRGLVKISKHASNSSNFTQCDSLIIGKTSTIYTIPYQAIKNDTAIVEHEATAYKINKEKMFYLMQRGIKKENTINMIVNGFCKDIFQKLPMEFAVEASALLEITLEGSLG
ncbi:Fe-S cluster assembly protein SufB [Candidatus Portiera aleyrodidarum]|uniref:Fe-S cluster assembly protein SufB n=1 Tax=Candidatus Portiera aleyrodidarum TaxID=91844 RepID=UPI000C776F5F|nr:Fe-S cluster assembly protein SufB [Candidatus Portiera aleyrodidarum]AUI72955.1 Fe-S cluster assembly protein SufB [Candidatus Portiera aleyrodidarum]AUI73206.1 Fe-S cluster assembly protein SufB [Candidatus Portiera aleyrodidarum]